MGRLTVFCCSSAFPASVSTRQQYRLLGNSLNVLVVARLLQLLVWEEPPPPPQHDAGGRR